MGWPVNRVFSRCAGDQFRDWFREISRECILDFDKLREQEKEQRLSDLALERSSDLQRHLYLFIHCHWNEGAITKLNAQVFLIDEAHPYDYLAEDDEPAGLGNYLRFDYDLTQVTKPFHDPFPHAHLRSDREPRLGIRNTAARTHLILDVIESAYRQFFFEKWVDWAKRVLAGCASGPDDAQALLDAFGGNELDTLSGSLPLLTKWREQMEAIKASVPCVRANADVLEALNY